MKKNQHADYDLWILLSRVYHLIAILRKTELAKYDIQPVQSYILLIIKALGNDTTPTEISRHVYQQKSSVSDILNRMEKKGLIKKIIKTGGKKRVAVTLTDMGEEALSFSENREYLYKVLSSLDESKKRQLESALEILSDKALKELSITQKDFLLPSQIADYYRNK